MSDALELAYKIGIAQGKQDQLGREIEELLNESKQSTEKDGADNGSQPQDDVRQVERANN